MAADALIGTTLGRRYRIDRLIGQGGMGRVYEAEHLHLKRPVALKVLNWEHANQADLRARFMREPRLAAATRHRNIIPVTDADEDDGQFYIVMELVSGTDLRELLRESEPLEPERVLDLLEQAAAGLDAAHRAHLVHRDIKPANILVGAGDEVFLTDFGLARGSGSDIEPTEAGPFFGTVAYAAPEQFTGSTVDRRTDLYSFGCVVFECFAGRPPFERASSLETVRAHIGDAPPRLSLAAPALPAALDQVIERALAKDPDGRYATAGEIVDDVRAAFGSQGRTLARSEERRPVATPSRRRWAFLLAALLGTAAALAAGFAVAAATRGSATPRASASHTVTRGRAPHLFSSGLVRVRAPANWSHRAAPSDTRALGMHAPLAVGPSARSRDSLVAAGSALSAFTPNLLTPALTRAVGGRPGTRLTLGSIQGIRYSNVALPGRSLDAVVYAFPTDRRVVFVLCLPGEPHAVSFLEQCERIASTVRPLNGYPVSLLAGAEYTSRLSAVLASLQRSLARSRPALTRAKTRAGEARASSSVASAYAGAARMLARLSPGRALRPVHQAVTADVRATSTAYRSLAGAATRGDSAAWRAASHQTALLESRTSRDIARLRAALVVARTSS